MSASVEQAMVSVSTGVMNSLLAKLAILMGEEHVKFSSISTELAFLRYELSTMNAFLETLANKGDLDPLTKEWRNQVREMAYDIEDWVDEVMHHLNQDDTKAGFIWKFIQRLNMLRTQNRITNQIQKLKTRVVEVSHRHKRYKLDVSISTPGYVAVDPRLCALYADAAGLVGIDGPRNEIAKWLIDSDRQLKVVSVVGIGGLGKTTLANEVYNKIGEQFNCRAFVSVSEKPDITKIVSNILSQLGQQPSSQACEVQDLLNDLREHLQDKRYFIIIDDLWDKSAWDILKCCLPKNNHASRVITTTRIETVAMECCSYRSEYVYKMRPLNNQNSKRLFFNRIFGSEDACPQQFREVSIEILERCGGLPLAIVSISSLLANQATTVDKQWECIRNSLGNKFGILPALDGMRQILHLSYKNLPYYLKTCFLYLGIYPEDYTIRKGDVVRQWVAEGFVSKAEGQDAEDVARSYFNELVNRSMILPTDIDYQNEVLSCKLHDMMLDLILCEAAEEKFITVADNSNALLGLHNNVHRLSLQFDNGNHVITAATTHLLHVRSMAIFGSSNYMHMHPLSEFKFLRVLMIVFSDVFHNMKLDLTGICKLFQLRYLNIEANIHVQIQLPAQIQELQQLETLEIEWGSVVIPSDIVYLPQLIRLIIPEGTILPDGIGNMKSLVTLQSFDLGENSLNNIKGLGELTNLRDLNICCSGKTVSNMARCADVLRSSLEKLCNLKHLYLYWPGGTYGNGLSSLSPSPLHLLRLDMAYWWFSKVPKWIGELHRLHSLKLAVKEVSKDDVDLLAQLPSLTNLGLRAQGTPKQKIIIYNMAFPVLRYFKFWCRTPCLVFEAEAMPALNRLKLRFNAQGWEESGAAEPCGIENLLGLKEIFLEIGGLCDKKLSRRAVESAFRKAIDMHPGCPSIKIIHCPHVKYYSD